MIRSALLARRAHIDLGRALSARCPT